MCTGTFINTEARQNLGQILPFDLLFVSVQLRPALNPQETSGVNVGISSPTAPLALKVRDGLLLPDVRPGLLRTAQEFLHGFGELLFCWDWLPCLKGNVTSLKSENSEFCPPLCTLKSCMGIKNSSRSVFTFPFSSVLFNIVPQRPNNSMQDVLPFSQHGEPKFYVSEIERFQDAEGPGSLTALCKTCWCCSCLPEGFPEKLSILLCCLDVQQSYHLMAHLENTEPGPGPAWPVSLAVVIYTL